MLIQKLRLQKGWSQEQLAEITGLSVRTIQRLEAGKPASLESLNTLAAVFNMDLNRLKDSDMKTVTATDLAHEEALALAHVRNMKGFYIHLAQYLVAMLILGAINLAVSPHYPWVVWPVLGWGVGVVAHGLGVFGGAPFFNGAWEKRQVEKYLVREL